MCTATSEGFGVNQRNCDEEGKNKVKKLTNVAKHPHIQNMLKSEAIIPSQKWEAIGPSKAHKYLETAPNHRKPNNSSYKQIVESIKNGRWKRTHQGIGFDENGKLVDGFKRLYAIIESKKEVEILVARGLNEETVKVIDRGRARQAGDILNIGHNMEEGRELAKYVRSASTLIYRRNLGNNIEAILKFYDEYRDGIDWLMERQKYRSKPWLRTEILTAFGLAYISFPAEIDEFYSNYENESEAPLELTVKLRNFAYKTLNSTKREAFLGTLSVLNAVVNGRTIQYVTKNEDNLKYFNGLVKG